MIIFLRGILPPMTAPKNPRITITPEAYQALYVQAALEMLPPGSLASKMILSQAQEAKKALQVTGRVALIHREPQKKLSERKSLNAGKPNLYQNPQALARIKDLWAQTPRPTISEIAKELGYSKATIAENIKNMIKAGETDSITIGRPYR